MPPVYNLSVPFRLKAWIDRLAVVGKTFSYSEGKGPDRLYGGKKLIVTSSRRGLFSKDTPAAAFDHREAYLKTLFGFLGVTDIIFICAEGIAMGWDAHNQAVVIAKDNASALVG